MEQSRYEQNDLPGYLEAEAKARESVISGEETQRHLARWAMRFEKYAKFSKDKEFRKRFEQQKKNCLDLMCGRQRD